MSQEEKEIRNLKRTELLELLIDEKKKNEELQKRINDCEARLAQRNLDLKEAGTLADAVIRINGMFEATDAACKQYTDNIKMLNDRTVAQCNAKLQTAEETATRMRTEAKAQCDKMIKEARDQAIADAEKGRLAAQEHWNKLYKKLEEYRQNHIEMQELLNVTYSRKD